MRSSWSRIFALALGLPLLLALLAACGAGTTGGNGGSTATTGSTIIKIATDFPASGKDTSSGKPAQDGANLAVNEANTNHTIPGYTLEFVPKDDVGVSGTHDPAVGAANVRALIGDALVAGIVGPFNSSVAEAEMPITNRAPIAQISPANTNTCLTQQGAAVDCVGATDFVPTLRPTGKVNYFRIAGTDNFQGQAGADYLFKTQHYKSVYVIDDAETYGIGLADSFEKEWKALGATFLGRSSEPGTTTSYVSLLTQIAAKHPDVIYFAGVDSTGGTLVRQQMEQIPSLANLPFGGGDGIVTPAFASTIGLKGGPIFGTIAVKDTVQNPATASFKQKFLAVYPTINVYSAAAYDCANILIQAIKTALANGAHTPKDSGDAAGAKLFRQAVISAIQNIQYDGVDGHQSFDANGDTNNKVFTIYQLGTVEGKTDWKFISEVVK